MGGIFRNAQIKQRYVPKTIKHEESLQRQVCQYLRLQYPHVIFRSDYSAGLHLTENQARINRSMQSGRGFPDLFIYHPVTHIKDGVGRQYHGMALELKKDGTSVILKIGPRKGMLSTDPHIQEQALVLKTLSGLGYYANFAVGFDEATQLIDWYFGRTKTEQASIF